VCSSARVLEIKIKIFIFWTYENINCVFFWFGGNVKIKPAINYHVIVPYYDQYLLFALFVGVVAQILLIVRPIAALLVRANLM
jgi:hypothetical protein